MMPIAGKPMLQHVIDRLRKCEKINQIIVATTNTGAEVEIVDLCFRIAVPFMKGSEEDVLDRFI